MELLQNCFGRQFAKRLAAFRPAGFVCFVATRTLLGVNSSAVGCLRKRPTGAERNDENSQQMLDWTRHVHLASRPCETSEYCPQDFHCGIPHYTPHPSIYYPEATFLAAAPRLRRARRKRMFPISLNNAWIKAYSEVVHLSVWCANLETVPLPSLTSAVRRINTIVCNGST